jgi:putative nucleotidyltransferase with HDIG domain
LVFYFLRYDRANEVMLVGRLAKRLFRRRLPAPDVEFVRQYLDERGQLLFFQMDLNDQRHSLGVARAILTKYGYQRAGVPMTPLMQAALLHDAGKVSGDLTTLSRIMVGFVRRLAPGLRPRLADREGNSFRRACYIDLHHAARGAYMAGTFGLPEEVTSIIRSHHNPPSPGERHVLTYLREADNRN